MPLRFLYYLKKDIPLEDITIQKEEVDSVEYMNTKKINKLIEENKILESHGIMFKELLKRMNN